MEDVTRATVRSIEIVKSRGHDFQMGRHSFRIVDGHGIEVYRRVQAPRRPSRDEAAAFDPTTRVSTGVPGPRRARERRLFPRQHDGGRRDLGRRQERHGAAVHGRRRAARRAQPDAHRSTNRCRRSSATRTSIGIDLAARRSTAAWSGLQYDTPQEIEIDRHFHNIEQRRRGVQAEARAVRQPVHIWLEPGHAGPDVPRLLSRAGGADEGAPDRDRLQPREPRDARDGVDDGRLSR